MANARLLKDEIREFLFSQTLHAFDPETLARVATVQYRPDWSCHVVMADASTDEGQYGFKGDFYWTRYNRFRDGALHRFSLNRIDENTAQAYFENGEQAFLQSSLAQLNRP